MQPIKTIRPVRDQVLVRRLPHDDASKGGIIIPDVAKTDRAVFGIVEAVGPGDKDKHGVFREVTVKVGQEVAIGRYLGSEIDLGDRVPRIVIRDGEILAVVER